MTQTPQIQENDGDLKGLDSADPLTRAVSREKAQNIIGNPEVELETREAIADRLLEANQELTRKTVTKDESY